MISVAVVNYFDSILGSILAIDVTHHIYEDNIDHLQLNNTSHVDIGTEPGLADIWQLL
jgi:hypothetical protein